MKEKTTMLEIISPKLTRREIQERLGCTPERMHRNAVYFDGKLKNNRISKELMDILKEAIKKEYLPRFKFTIQQGWDYQTPLKRFAKERYLKVFDIGRKKTPKRIRITSEQSSYLEHDKKVQKLGQLLRRKGILAVPTSCWESNDFCSIPSQKEWFASIGHHNSSEGNKE